MNKVKSLIGDILVCVDNLGSESHLTTNKRYTVIENSIAIAEKECVAILSDNNTFYFCHRDRFLSLVEYRNIRIGKIV